MTGSTFTLGRASRSAAENSVAKTQPGSGAGVRRASKHVGAAIILVIGASLTQLLPWATRANNAGALQEAKARLSVVQRNNAALTKERADLMSDSEISRLAREEFGFAPIGAEVYAVANLRTRNSSDGSASGSSLGVRSGSRSTPSTVAPSSPSDISSKQSRVSRIVDVLVFWD